MLYHNHKKHTLTHVFFPMFDSMPTFLHAVQASKACPTVATTPEAAHAAFTKESDLFGDNGIVFKKTFVNLDDTALCARQMYRDWQDELGVTEAESYRATLQGLAALEAYNQARRKEAREIIDRLERENKLGIVLLARPYHNDPGINHEICEQLQKLGYPVLTEDSLPIDEDILDRLFGDEVRAGEFAHPLSIEDAWKNSYSENTSRKVWSSKYVARHPNLVALELSSFKCGHDAPIYSVVEEIIENSRTPYFCFKDIDENKPSGSIKIRIETMAYFLERYRQKMAAADSKREHIEDQLAEFEADLRAGSNAARPELVPEGAVVGV